jgi:hypothetical protein
MISEAAPERFNSRPYDPAAEQLGIRHTSPTAKVSCAVTFGDHSIKAAPMAAITRIKDIGLLRLAFIQIK